LKITTVTGGGWTAFTTSTGITTKSPARNPPGAISMCNFKGVIVRKLLVLTLFGLAVTTLVAQETQTISPRSSRLGDRQSASKYILSASGDALLMTVKIWGEVQKPGLYDVPIGTDLIELISAAGGPTQRANLSKVKIIHETVNETNEYVSSINVKHFIEKGVQNEIPEIKPSDTIIVPVKPTQYLLTSLSWTQQFLSLLSVYSMIIYYTSIRK